MKIGVHFLSTDSGFGLFTNELSGFSDILLFLDSVIGCNMLHPLDKGLVTRPVYFWGAANMRLGCICPVKCGTFYLADFSRRWGAHPDVECKTGGTVTPLGCTWTDSTSQWGCDFAVCCWTMPLWIWDSLRCADWNVSIGERHYLLFQMVPA